MDYDNMFRLTAERRAENRRRRETRVHPIVVDTEHVSVCQYGLQGEICVTLTLRYVSLFIL
jgi:hypothetical protein